MSDDELLAWLEERENKKNDRVIAYLIEQGRPDIAAELEERIKSIRLGIDGARATWSALSVPQRSVLMLMGEGCAHLVSAGPVNRRFVACGPGGYFVSGIHGATVNNLLHRELVSWAPDKKVILTERGRFVLKFGQGGQP